MRTRSALLSALLCLASAGAARADAILGPPETCPPGAEGDASHAGSYCRATTCAGDADCGEGRVCREQPLCVRDVRVVVNTYRTRGVEEILPVAIGACEDGRCEPPTDTGVRVRGGVWVGEPLGPARCLRERRCVAADAPPPHAAPRPAPAEPPPHAAPRPAPAEPATAPRRAHTRGGGASCSAAPPAGGGSAALVLVGSALALARRRRSSAA